MIDIKLVIDMQNFEFRTSVQWANALTQNVRQMADRSLVMRSFIMCVTGIVYRQMVRLRYLCDPGIYVTDTK